MQRLSHQLHRFDGFTLDVDRGCLLRGAQEIKLRPKPFEALKYLVENPGRLISKAELIEKIWPDTAVTDDSLVQCLIEVRRALGDDAQQIIKTVPRRGYIFEKPVESGPGTPLTTYKEETTGVQVIIEEEETDGHAMVETTAFPAYPVVRQIATKTGALQRLIVAVRAHKSITAALSVFTVAIAAAGIVYFTRPAPAIDSIAVMPFVNVNSDPNAEYLSDGISDSIIDKLSQLPNLKKVIALNSVLRYKGKQTDPQTVGRELGVRAVLIGRLTQRGDQLSISAELVDVLDNRRIWGEQFERKMSDLPILQRELASQISEHLRLKLTGQDQKQLQKRYTENAEAYDLYLKGRFAWNRRQGFKKSIEYYNQAIEKDPNFALAYAGLADAYALLPGFSGASPQDAYPKAKAAAQKALELDETLAEAHTALALLLDVSDFDLPASCREFQRAIELNPNYATAHHWYSNGPLLAAGRYDEAIAEGKRAQELDPFSPILNVDLGDDYIYARQYDKAIEQLRAVTETYPNFYVGVWNLGFAYEMKGSFQEALVQYEKARQLNPDDTWVIALLGHAYAASGKRDDALKMIETLKEISGKRYVAAYSFAIVYAALDDKDQGFQWLEKSYQDRAFSDIGALKVDPLVDNLRSDPRFTDLLRRLKLNV
jgi:TolB-like protein/DNA-binding winged helix-turn-helix (wHTH) protein/Tfp pilus assembly protein PilF